MNQFEFEVRLVDKKTGTQLSLLRSTDEIAVFLDPQLAHSSTMSPKPPKDGFYEVDVNQVITAGKNTTTIALRPADGDPAPKRFPNILVNGQTLQILRVRETLPPRPGAGSEYGPEEWHFNVDAVTADRARVTPADTVRSVFNAAVSAMNKAAERSQRA